MGNRARMQFLITMILTGVLAGCFLPSPKQQLTAKTYRDRSKGYVVLSVIWKRYWTCADYANAQLQRFGFDRMPIGSTSDEPPPDILIEGSSFHALPQPVDYVLAVEPGEYALSVYSILVERGIERTTDVFYWGAGRSKLFRNNEVLSGTFDVKAGEIVYIGHFGLDCFKEPRIWRYYPQDHEDFDKYRKLVKNKYSYLDVDAMQYRLLKTSSIGINHELP
jgi:hypothetical protein